MDWTTEDVVGLLTETLPNRLVSDSFTSIVCVDMMSVPYYCTKGLEKLKTVESWKRYQLADVSGALLQKVLANKGLTSNKSEMNYVSGIYVYTMYMPSWSVRGLLYCLQRGCYYK